MNQFMMLVVLIGSFWVGLVWADMDRVSKHQAPMVQIKNMMVNKLQKGC
jgi:hypothetical protein